MFGQQFSTGLELSAVPPIAPSSLKEGEKGHSNTQKSATIGIAVRGEVSVMEKFVAGAIAVIIAALGVVLFGKPQGESSASSESTEAVNQPPASPPPTPPASADSTSAAVTELPVQVHEPVDVSSITTASGASANTSPTPAPTQGIADPWVDSNEGSITFDVSQPEAAPEATSEAPSATPIEVNVDAISQVEPVPAASEAPPSVRATTARYNAVATQKANPANALDAIDAPFAAIQDPRRPKTAALQDISQQILDWGNSKQLSNIPKVLAYANNTDPVIRSYVALALGQIAAPHTVKSEIEKVIPALGKLSQDSNPDVRQMAIKALSSIQSPDVLPYLETGLLSSSGVVKQAANAAIQKLKLHYGPQTGGSEFPPSLQKPADQ